jgi:putative ABC transport system permease protein
VGAFLDTLSRDLRYAVRTLASNPGFAVVAILTLALGIGANTTMFTVVNAVLLKPLPYPEPERVLMLWEKPLSGGRLSTVAPSNFLPACRAWTRTADASRAARFRAATEAPGA